MRSVTSVSTRFWLGVALPTLLLAFFISFLILATGHGREFAPMAMLILSLVALPATMLANCWTLFVTWSSRAPLFIGGLVVPLYVGSGMTIFIHGTGSGGNVGATMLAPFFMILSVATAQPIAAFGIWLLGMTAFILWARAVGAQG